MMVVIIQNKMCFQHLEPVIRWNSIFSLYILLLQKIERETEAAKVLNRKVTESRKVVIYKDKGKRELRNLQSSVNYDGR